MAYYVNASQMNNLKGIFLTMCNFTHSEKLINRIIQDFKVLYKK